VNVLVLTAVLAGFVLLTVGGEVLVTGAGRVSERFGMHPATVGATVVAVATSAPELAVSLGSAVHGDLGLALGNVVGSNIANVLLVLGAAAAIAPLRIPAGIRRVDLPVCIAATTLLLALAWDGSIGRLDGLVLLALFAATMTWSVHSTRTAAASATPSADGDAADVSPRPSAARGAALVVAGTAGLVAGAELLVYGAGSIARGLGVSEVVIGLTVVAIGTSLPELAAAVSAGRSGNGDLAVGNAIGSNVANLGLVLGLPAALLAPIPVPQSALRQDIPLALAAVVVLWALARWRGGLGRSTGLFLLAGYTAYLTSLAVSVV